MRKQAPEDIMTIQDVADWLHVADVTVYRWVEHKQIPFLKIAGTIRFLRSDLLKWMRDNGNTAVGEVVAETVGKCDGTIPTVTKKYGPSSLAKLRAIKAEALKNAVSHE